MAIRTSRPLVGTSATPLARGIGGSGISLSVYALDDVYLGGYDVTPDDGFLLLAGLQFNMTLEQNETLYAVGDVETQAYVITQGA